MNWTRLGALLLGVAVLLGAFGAHGLRSRLDPASLEIWEKAVFYQFVHAFGILIAPVLARTSLIGERCANTVCILLTIGILSFSGSLYALALSGVGVLGAVTPIGGVAFVTAWVLLAFGIPKRR